MQSNESVSEESQEHGWAQSYTWYSWTPPSPGARRPAKRMHVPTPHLQGNVIRAGGLVQLETINHLLILHDEERNRVDGEK